MYGFMAVFYFYVSQYWREFENLIESVIKAAKEAGYYDPPLGSIKNREEGRCYRGYAKSRGKYLPQREVAARSQ